MRCMLCRVKPTVFVPVPALYVVAGLSVCTLDAERLVDALLEGYSAKDVLDEAKSGDW